MRELAATGIVSWQEGKGKVGQSIALEKNWKWLLPPIAEEPVEDGRIADEFPAVKNVPLWVMVQPFKLGSAS